MSRHHAGSYIRKSLRLAVILTDEGRCFYCGAPLPIAGWLAGDALACCEVQVDHVTPKAEGGDGWANLVTCCGDCNEAKRGGLEQLYAKRGLDLDDVKRRLVLRRKRRPTRVRQEARDILRVVHVVETALGLCRASPEMNQLRRHLLEKAGL